MFANILIMISSFAFGFFVGAIWMANGYTYEAFMKAGIPVKYEPKHFTLLPKFTYMDEKIRPITYLPDFIGKNFVVECKGLMGDSFPLRFKLFKHYLKRHRSKMKCYIVRNHKQVDEMIEELKSQKS